MIISAKFASTCPVCGNYIKVGARIEWSKGQRACHEACANGPVRSGQTATTKAKAASVEPAPFRLSGGSGYGCNGWDVGQTVHCNDRLKAQGYPEYITVVRAHHQYVREDGLSLGVGDESGYSYSAECREATEAEAAPVRSRLEKAAAKKAAQMRVQEISQIIQTTGEYRRTEDGTQYRLETEGGERLLDTQTIYGGGSWFIVVPSTSHLAGLWYCRNSGGDGDDWSRNNVATGGAGAIGWRLDGDNDLVSELRSLAAVLA